MFQDDSAPVFYREVNNNNKVICSEPLYKYLDARTHKNARLKVLEIGAGTGASTNFILDALKANDKEAATVLNCSRYDYTDISPAFFG